MTIRTNWDRANEGLRLCELMQEMTGVDDICSQISDAVCQLMHVARLVRDEDGEQIDFADALSSATINFNAEVHEDPDEIDNPEG